MSMKGLIINHGTRFIDELIILFPNCSVIDHKEFESINPEEFDYIVLSGGPIHISNPTDLQCEKSFILNTNKPIFGICLGLELLGVTFGSKLLELENERDSMDRISINNLSGYIKYKHSWHIKEVPQDFVELYRTDVIVDCMVHKTKPIFAIQGHPELSKNFGNELKNFFIEHFVIKHDFIQK